MIFDSKSTLFSVPARKGLFLTTLILSLIASSCATKKVQYGKRDYVVNSDTLAKSKLLHTFFLIGDAGNSDESIVQEKLEFFRKRLAKASTKSTLLFLGDNIYPAGLPKKEKPERKAAEEKLDFQIGLTKDFKGKTIFIPGNHDWYSEGIDGLKRQEKYVTGKLGKKSFLPKDGCPIETVEVDDYASLIIVDSEWYLENWDDDPDINDDCDVKTREDFFEDLEDALDENQKRLTVLAIHHPLMSNGPHGGQYSWIKQLYPTNSDFPIPIGGSILNLLRKTSGASPQDIRNKKYTEYVKRVKTLVQGRDNVVVVSGHEHNLQYLELDGVKQVISGAGSKIEAARAIWKEDFSYGGTGYATLQVYEKGESVITYYGLDGKDEKLLYRHLITAAREDARPKEYGTKFPAYTTASVYTEKETKKGFLHNFLWGKHFRGLYSRPVKARTVILDTLYGGLKPVESGGGHQSKSLKLEDKSGKQYTMRALRKSAVKFLQKVAFKKVYVEQEFEGTYAEDFLMDFYTSAHPYTSFAIDDLAGAVGISHTNPKLFYVPKQTALGDFNLDYGDELYLIEERPDDGFEQLKSFGKPDALVSTNKVLENLQKDEKYVIDEKAYIRARLFDMLIGDWDRHYDQWRWGEYESDGKVLYKPIPRDRDQAFPKYGGALLSIVLSTPALRHMKTYKEDIGSVKWLNAEAYTLDLALLRTATEADWEEQARYIQEHLTDREVDAAFNSLPKEMQDSSLQEIKRRLLSRRSKLRTYAKDYFAALRNIVPVVGTDKKDKFVISRNDAGDTRVVVSRIKSDGEEERFTQTFVKGKTREIWIYGLGDDDVFEVTDSGKPGAIVRLLGGGGKDSYNVKKGARVFVYDFRSRENDVDVDGRTAVLLSNNYELNRYDYRKPKYNSFGKLPNLGFNPDDGVKIGARFTYTINGFKRNPFSQKHVLLGNYYFATEGYELIYRGIFPNVLRNWHFELDARYTSPVFSFNFFGYGNETVDYRDAKGMDYNRVKSQVITVAPSFVFNGDNGGFACAQATFESYAIQNTDGRFINTGVVNPDVFRQKQFLGGNVSYGFENYDSKALPTLGLKFHIEAGWKFNVADVHRDLPYAMTLLGMSHRILRDGRLVAATQAKAKMLFSNEYEFYQMATIGGDYDVRAFRTERFSGKSSFFQSSDLRYEIGRIRRTIVPLRYGVLGGFDYGRVWLPGEESDTWHTAYGGGLWLTGIDVITAKISYFHSIEGGRVSFGLGFGF